MNYLCETCAVKVQIPFTNMANNDDHKKRCKGCGRVQDALLHTMSVEEEATLEAYKMAQYE